MKQKDATTVDYKLTWSYRAIVKAKSQGLEQAKLEPKWLEPKWREPKWLEPKWLERKRLDPKLA